MTTIRSKRLVLLGAAAITVAAGLAVHAFATGPVADAAGDALYAALVTFLVAFAAAFAAPRVRIIVVAVIAYAICAGIELFQLTGIPLMLAGHWPPFAFVFGSGFSAVDLLSYAAGTAIAAAALTIAERRARQHERRMTGTFAKHER